MNTRKAKRKAQAQASSQIIYNAYGNGRLTQCVVN